MFKTKKIISQESQRVGGILKQAREEKDISLEEISEATKIQRRYLEDIENGEYQNLPPDIYTCGFIKRCACFLRLDGEKIASFYRRERCIQEKMVESKGGRKVGAGSADVFKKDFSNSFSKRKLFIVTPKILTLLLGIIVLATVIFYLWHQISSFNTVPQLRLSEPSEDQIINQDDIYFRGQTEKDVELKINGEVVCLDPLGNFEVEVNLQEGLNVIVLEAENHFGKKAKVVRRVIYER